MIRVNSKELEGWGEGASQKVNKQGGKKDMATPDSDNYYEEKEKNQTQIDRIVIRRLYFTR